MPAWGNAPGKRSFSQSSAVSANQPTHGDPINKRPVLPVSRAFSAINSFDQKPGALPQAAMRVAPLALNKQLLNALQREKKEAE